MQPGKRKGVTCCCVLDHFSLHLTFPGIGTLSQVALQTGADLCFCGMKRPQGVFLHPAGWHESAEGLPPSI